MNTSLSGLKPLAMTPAGAASAYGRVASGAAEAPQDGAADALGGVGGDVAGGFGRVLTRALEGVVETGKRADAQSVAAISGTGNVTEVVTAVARAELALQSVTAVRDRVVQAYQDIMRMPI